MAIRPVSFIGDRDPPKLAKRGACAQTDSGFRQGSKGSCGDREDAVPLHPGEGKALRRPQAGGQGG